MPRLLVVHHSPTRNASALTDALVSGAHDPDIAGVEVVVRRAPDAGADDVNAADAVLLSTVANFGYMAGLMKDFFDRTFLDIGGALSDDGSAGGTGGSGRTPWGLCLHGRYDLTGAVRSVESIVSALPWRRAAPVLEVLGDVAQPELDAAYELGGTLAALLT